MQSNQVVGRVKLLLHLALDYAVLHRQLLGEECQPPTLSAADAKAITTQLKRLEGTLDKGVCVLLPVSVYTHTLTC